MPKPKLPDEQRRDRLPLRVRLNAEERETLEQHVQGTPLASWVRELAIGVASGKLEVIQKSGEPQPV